MEISHGGVVFFDEIVDAIAVGWPLADVLIVEISELVVRQHSVGRDDKVIYMNNVFVVAFETESVEEGQRFTIFDIDRATAFPRQLGHIERRRMRLTGMGFHFDGPALRAALAQTFSVLRDARVWNAKSGHKFRIGRVR